MNRNQQSIKAIITNILITAFLVLISSQNSWSQTMPSPLEADGGQDCHLYKTDTVMLENTIIDDGSPISPEGSFTTGFNMFHSPYLKMLYLPLVYSITDNFAVDLTLPLLHKMLIDNTNDVSKLAFGDIKLGVTSSFSFNNDKIVLSTQLKSTIPTGDSNATSGALMIPLGYGNFTFSLLQSVSLKIPNIYSRFFINAGGILYLPVDYTYSDTTTFKVNLTYLVSSLFGIEFTYFEDLSLFLKGNFAYQPGRTYRQKNETTGFISQQYDVNDLLITTNIITSLTYNFSKNRDVKGTLMLIFPVWTKQDDNVAYEAERKWKIYMSIVKIFSLSTKDTVPIPQVRPSSRRKR